MQPIIGEYLQYVFKIIVCDPSIYIMDNFDLTVSNLTGNFIGAKRVKTGLCVACA